MDRSHKKAYFDLQKLSFQRCLEPSEQCENEPIRSHSIQNSRVLDLLCHKGHVIVPQLTHVKSIPKVVFSKMGRNQATTFPGLCAHHDQEMFRPIETAPIDTGDEAHLFLLAYRAVLKETHASIEEAVKVQLGYQSRVEGGRSPGGRPDSAGIMAVEWMMNSYDTYECKRKFETAYLAGDFKRLGHYRLVFEGTAPSIAVNALFSLDDIEWSDDVARVAMNVFPEANCTHVVFSFLREEKAYATQYLQRILDATGHYQRYLVSKLVLQHCGNLVISPTYFDQLSEARREAIVAFFRRTMMRNEHDYEDENLYLF